LTKQTELERRLKKISGNLNTISTDVLIARTRMGAAGSKSSDPTAGDNALFNNFSGEEIRRLAKRFTKLDIDKSGWISFEEMMEWPEFKSNPLAKRIYAVMDKDSDGKVDLQEFLNAFSQIFEPRDGAGKSNGVHSDEKGEARFRVAFKIYDVDGDGYISRDDVFQAVKIMVGKGSLTDAQILHIVNRAWKYMANKDEKDLLDFEQFCQMLKGSAVGEKLADKFDKFEEKFVKKV